MELFPICLLEATSSNPVGGISTLPLPFHTKLSWLPLIFVKKSAFTTFHSYELASFFILSWIWLPTCSGSILSVQVSVGGWLMRGENQRTVVSLPPCLQHVRLLPSVTASRWDPPCTLHLTRPHFSNDSTKAFFSYLKCRGKLKKRKSYCRKSLR